MKGMIFNKLTATLLCSTALVTSSYAAQGSSDDHKFYFGIDGGYSAPPPGKHKFEEKTDLGTVIGKLQGTEVYEGKIGYKIYPNLGLEIAYAYRPKYKLGIALPDQPTKFGVHGGLTNTTSKTNVASHTVMLNLMYEAQSEKAYRPYFLFGIGYANVTAKVAPINGTVPLNVAQGSFNGNTRPTIGNIKHFVSHRLGWRVGTGMIYDVNEHFAITGGVKLEVINKIGLHTQYTDGTQKSLKKTIGVVDLTIGARYSL